MMRFSVKQLNMFGTLVRTSKFGGCPRQWGFRYLDGLEDEQNESMRFGIRFHDVCAALVKTGQMPTSRWVQPGVYLSEEDVKPESIYGKMARAGLRYLPRSEVPETGEVFRTWETEAQGLFTWMTRDGLEVQLDLRPDVFCLEPVLIHLVDWKSTSGDSLDDLSLDIQSNVYAAGLMQVFERTEVFGRWVYINKKPPHKAWPVDAMFQRESVHDFLHEHIDGTLELMHMFRENGSRALDLPGDPEACMFCPYVDPCYDITGPYETQLIELESITRYKKDRTL